MRDLGETCVQACVRSSHPSHLEHLTHMIHGGYRLFQLLDFLSTSFFFFQAEDGIRDIGVTGVQTCALPICGHEVLGFDHNPAISDATDIADLVKKLGDEGPRVAWVMVPSGEPTEQVVQELDRKSVV